MSDPIPLILVKNEPVPAVVAFLEQLLERAKAGEVQAIAFALRTADGDFDTWWGGGLTFDLALATGITRLAWRYQNEAFSETTVISDAPA